ncbi:Ketopantoate reductase ApbA/PanE domain-containing protein [Candidatus Methylobacter favarea]|uniref:Ketopantoate reductase ApbA/PanE domain-containing protein n=1 Tax=Candidatus Methylobacter favarea TaxID=2707345 RepID=A0A8S0X2E1_9GAMM|nr:SDR family oxidoreductase [Candidatus Methylobacter favarea]CAA9891832.1 Ketopantoate reductase ApbA/PanE domain-containing protein [Candidatus Methylobacter favarea]
MAKILIIGCGAIGLQLAEVLSANGHQITGLKRHPPVLQPSKINYFTADISLRANLEDLDADFKHVFFIASTDGRNEKSYRDIYEIGLDNLLNRFSQSACNPDWIFVSSTSVYGQSQGEWVDENSLAQPDNITSKLIRQAEQKLMDANPNNIIVRFAGIYGPGREYLLRMARQAPLIQQDPPYFTNRIHQDDCVNVLSFLFEKRLIGLALEQCYLASDDDPAPLWNVISWLAERMNCPPPVIQSAGSKGGMNKRCINTRLKALGYQFKYPGYKEGYSELINKTGN